MSTIDVYYEGVRVGGATCPNNNFNRVTSGIQFTTDTTGMDRLEVRFVNTSGMRGLCWYVDEIFATALN